MLSPRWEGTRETHDFPGGTRMGAPVSSIRVNHSLSEGRSQVPSTTFPFANTKALPDPVVFEAGRFEPDWLPGGLALY